MFHYNAELAIVQSGRRHPTTAL